MSYAVFPVLISLFLFVYLGKSSSPSAAVNGFVVRAVHSHSRFFYPNLTKYDWAALAYQDTVDRLHNYGMKISSVDIGMRITPQGFGYLVEAEIGTPRIAAFLTIDTGSDLTWVQCLPCILCYKQDWPIFEPVNSSSYQPILCSDDVCKRMRGKTNGCTVDGFCATAVGYGDKFVVQAKLGLETFYLPDFSEYMELNNITFGCVSYSTGSHPKESTGIMGLGRDSLAITSQLSVKKFSYCFSSNINIQNYVKFGSVAEIRGNETPVLPLSESPFGRYYVNVEAVYVGNQKVDFNAVDLIKIGEIGGFAIDSGTTLTALQEQVFRKVFDEVDDQIEVDYVDFEGGVYETCYDGTESDLDRMPHITFILAGGVNLTSPSLVPVDEHIICLAIVKNDDFSILGIRAQNDYNVGYDNERGVISFEKSDCID